MTTTTGLPDAAAPSAPAAGRSIDHFMPVADVAERHEFLIHAPADVVMHVARELDIDSIWLVRAIFWLRGILMGSKQVSRFLPRGLVAKTRALGWGVLSEQDGREYVSGAVTQPWNANVAFRRIPAKDFKTFAEPDWVKIAWTLEAEPLTGSLTRFASETRALATDSVARQRFLRYWRWAGVGIVAIRLLVGPAIRREAERRYRRHLATM
jgi:hypothetical protein